MEFKLHKLDNGLTIAGEVNELAQTAAIGFFVKTGSRDETAEINGVSHYLEHMLFKGTEELSALDVNEAFDRTGAQFNAFTSEENTVYYAAVLPEYLDQVTELWAKLMRCSLRDDDFDMEKNVILEEIAMYKDMPNFEVIDRARSLHFENHPCGNSVLGTVESITNLKSDQMREYFWRRYSPDNITVVCCGNFDFDRLVGIIERLCGSWTPAEAGRLTSPHTGSFKSITEKKANLNQQHICLVSSAVSIQDSRRHACGLLGNIIGDSGGSRFFWELVDPAIAEVAECQAEPMDGTGAFYSYIRCSPQNTEKAMATVNRVFADLKKDGITADELDKARHKILSSLTIKNELPMGRLTEVGFNWVYLNEYRTISQEVETLKAVTTADINALIEEFDPGRYTMMTLQPQK